MKVDLMIIGAMKCGTTTLADLLKAHDAVSFCKEKEPEFFSKDPDWRSNIDRYHALFTPKAGALFAEASTGHTFQPNFNRNIRNDLFDYNPLLKFIYLVRDPIDRIVSHYMHIYERGYISIGLEEAVRTLPIMLNVTRYHAQVLPYIERFGKDHVLLLRFDQLMTERDATLAKVAAFTGLRADGFQAENVHSNPSLGGNKTLHWADRPPRWARWVRTLTPIPLRERLWDRITRDTSRAFTAKPELSGEWKESVMRLLETDVLALEELAGWDLTAWWQHAGIERPEQRIHNK